MHKRHQLYDSSIKAMYGKKPMQSTHMCSKTLPPYNVTRSTPPTLVLWCKVNSVLNSLTHQLTQIVIQSNLNTDIQQINIKQNSHIEEERERDRERDFTLENVTATHNQSYKIVHIRKGIGLTTG